MLHIPHDNVHKPIDIMIIFNLNLSDNLIESFYSDPSITLKLAVEVNVRHIIKSQNIMSIMPYG